LERIDLCDNEISEANAAELINTLNTMPGLHNLLDLCLGGNILCDAACEALCSLLTNPACQIQHLDLRFTCLEDDDLDELVDALTENNTLRSLNLICLDDVTSSGWRRLSSYLSSPNCSLEKIWLGGNRIWDATAAPLRNALVGHRTLKCLDLCMSCFVPRSGWRQISKCLREPDPTFVELHLGRCRLNDDDAITIFNALARNSSLKVISMAANDKITSTGWAICFRLLLHSQCNLEELDLHNNDIDDDGAAELANLVARNMTTVKSLNLSLTSMTTIGCRSLTDVLKINSSSKVNEMRFGNGRRLWYPDTPITDDVIISFAEALAGNTSLKVCEILHNEISARGWAALGNALCNKSNLASICNSNHTLYDFWTDNLPSEILVLQQMNNNKNQSEVLRKKLLMYHFSDNGNAGHAFCPMETTVLPNAIEWIGRDEAGFQLMYELVKGMTHCLLSAKRTTNAGEKRKREL